MVPNLRDNFERESGKSFKGKVETLLQVCLEVLTSTCLRKRIKYTKNRPEWEMNIEQCLKACHVKTVF